MGFRDRMGEAARRAARISLRRVARIRPGAGWLACAAAILGGSAWIDSLGWRDPREMLWLTAGLLLVAGNGARKLAAVVGGAETSGAGR